MVKYYFLFFVISTAVLFSCDEKEDAAPAIEGTWRNDSESENTAGFYRNEIIFKSGGTYEQSIQLVNDQQTIGFISLILGEYQVDGEKLIRSNVKEYGLDNESPYLPRKDLVLSGSTAELPEVNISLSGEVLILESECPEFSLCAEGQEYFRVDD